MAATQATVVYANLEASSSVHGQLFEGKKFWIAQRTPARSFFVNQVRSNGGSIVPLEKNADYLICDHMKNDGPPGGISYEFIDHSIRQGTLADPDSYLVGPARGAVRDVGSLRPTKQTRTPFSMRDDAILWEWVKRCEAKGSSVKGNEMYKQLEVNHPNHTWQAWRDRYLKTLDKRPEEWKRNFGAQAETLLGGLNSQDETVTTPTRTKRARSDEHKDQSSIPIRRESTKKQRVSGPNREDAEEELPQARRNSLPRTTVPYKPPRGQSPSSQLISEQEEAAQRSSFQPQYAPIPRSTERSPSPELIDLVSQRTEDSDSALADEEDMDDLLLPEPEGGFAPEIQFQTQTQNQIQTQHPSSPPVPSWNPDESLPSSEESEPEPNFHTLYTSYKNRGYSDPHIATAFHVTSANPKLLEPVLEELNAGRGVPQDRSGVWTEDDDELLMSLENDWDEVIATSRGPWIVRKHGLRGCDWRRAFLERMRLGNHASR